MAKICIISHTHLSRNPRALKESLALSSAGHEVYILNSIYSKILAEEELRLLENTSIRVKHVVDLSEKSISTFFFRIIKRIAGLLVKYLKIETSFALGYAPLKYLKVSEVINADLYICHQELPLYIGIKLLEKGYKVGFDIEDWHSEDLSEETRKARPIKLLRQIEKIALTKGFFCTTTSYSLAERMALAYETKLPEVIYNSFPLSENLSDEIKITSGPLRLCWFSLNVGAGRGLEEFIQVINKIPEAFEIHLIGEVEESFKRSIEELNSNHHILVFHSLVPADKLCALLSSFDIGLALELNEPLNRKYTITNKFFQYIQCGLPVIATNTKGQSEIFDRFNPGILIDFGKINFEELKICLTDRNNLLRFRDQVDKTARYYDWKNHSKKIIKIVESVL